MPKTNYLSLYAAFRFAYTTEVKTHTSPVYEKPYTNQTGVEHSIQDEVEASSSKLLNSMPLSVRGTLCTYGINFCVILDFATVYFYVPTQTLTKNAAYISEMQSLGFLRS